MFTLFPLFFRALLFERHQLRRLVGDVLCAHFEFLNQFPGRAGVAKAVFHSDGAGDQGQPVKFRALGENRTDPPCQCSDLMLFGGDHNAGIVRRANRRLPRRSA